MSIKSLTANAMLIAGSVNAAIAVLAGAFGAHALKKMLSQELLTVYQTGVQYHFYHALGLILFGLTLTLKPQVHGLKLGGGLLLVGIVLFSGSLYLMVLTGFRGWGMITPFGGVAFIVAWLVYGWGVWRGGRTSLR